MKPGQKEIFYLTGETRNIVEHSPHLEALKKNEIEILYLVEPVDELLTQSLMDYQGKRLKSAAKGTISLGADEDKQQTEDELKEITERSAGLLERIQKRLDPYVKQVRLTNRLVSSPACLVGTEIDYSPQMERLLQMGKGDNPKQRRIMELNPWHEIFARMQTQFQTDSDDRTLSEYGELLLGYALLAEGSELHDPVRFNSLVIQLMLQK
jgi:molecular chaperone HtpG